MKVRFLFYHLMWSLSNYVVRNPLARKAAGQGCLALILLWVGFTLLSAILAAIGAAATEVNAWIASTPDSVIALVGIGLAALVGAITYLLIARPAWREQLACPLRALKARLGRADTATGDVGAGAMPALPSADDLAKIRFPAKTGGTGMTLPHFDEAIDSADDLLDQIVVHEGE